MSGRLEIGRITVGRYSSPRLRFRIYFAQNAAGKNIRDSFPTSYTYVFVIYQKQWERIQTQFDLLSVRLEIGRITICWFSSPDPDFRYFFAQNTAGKHRLDGFPTWSMYFWSIRSSQRRFKPNLSCWAVGGISVVSQYVDFRHPYPHFGFFAPKKLRKNIVSVVFLLDLCICDILEAMREDLNPIWLLSR